MISKHGYCMWLCCLVHHHLQSAHWIPDAFISACAGTAWGNNVVNVRFRKCVYWKLSVIQNDEQQFYHLAFYLMRIVCAVCLLYGHLVFMVIMSRMWRDDLEMERAVLRSEESWFENVPLLWNEPIDREIKMYWMYWNLPRKMSVCVKKMMVHG